MKMYIYDPTASDSLSKVRGIGRYLEILQEAFHDHAEFTSDLHTIPFTSTVLNPFFDPIKPPLSTKRIAQKQIAVIHDLIRLKYPAHFPLGLKGKLNVFRNTIALRNYDLIITDSYVSKRDIIQILKIDANKIKIIYPCLSKKLLSTLNPSIVQDDAQTLAGIYNLKPKTYCIYVGDATWNKNIVNLAKAIKSADVKCVFVGKVFTSQGPFTHPEQQELRLFLEETANDPRFIFPGFVSNEDLAVLYKHAIANILVSRDEGFGFSYLEAGLFETPSVLADRPIFHEIAQDAALFANPEHPDHIAHELKTFITDVHKRTIYGHKAHVRCLFFSEEKFKKELESIL